jgi:superfamily I DNA and/or RNA helicase
MILNSNLVFDFTFALLIVSFSPSATIRRVGSHTHSASTGTENDPTLSKTLFVRLAAAGIVPLMLAVQYRLHPHLSDLPNRLFYQQRLSNGVAASDRAALIPHLPPLSFVEIPNGREMLSGPGGSFVNSEECHAVTQLSSALAHHVDASDIGIISLCAFDLTLAFFTYLIAPLFINRVRPPVYCTDKAQAFKIQEAVCAIVVADGEGIVCSTVDAFQGAERVRFTIAL